MSYFDLQVNGAFGVDFNDDTMSPEAFVFACQKLQELGVVGFLPTIITDSIDTMCGRIRKIVSILESHPQTRQLVPGLHIEGPFLSSKIGFYGTHPPQHILPAKERDAMRLLDAGNGHIRLVTLAPEQDPDCSVLRRLCAEKAIVFAGHTDASYAMLQRALDDGLVGFTHLGNGCVHQVDRQDNIMQRVLALKEKLYVTLIADGIHLPDWLLNSWIHLLGVDRCIIISDSMNAAGMPPGEYAIGNQRVLVDASRRTRHRDHGYLAGSASTMHDMDQYLQRQLDLDEAVRQKILLHNARSLIEKR